ncbi:MAG: DUF721 domain-containing protein [Kofleriaceae bacterium]|nr:DUF721 domain-containing protein [Candidatus Methylomirabilis lanthanidiphila]
MKPWPGSPETRNDRERTAAVLLAPAWAIGHPDGRAGKGGAHGGVCQVKATESRQRKAQAAPARCADILESSLQGLGFGRIIRHLALLRAWDRAVADRIKERVSVEDFRGGCLYLCAEDPVWMHELHMLRHQLKTILNKEVGESVVGEIVLRIGRTRPSPPAGRANRRRQRIPTGLPAIEANMANLLSPLRDLPCCDAVQRLYQRWASGSQ